MGGIVTIVTENRNKAVPLQKRNTMHECLNCGNDFNPKNPKGKYCSDRCKVAYNRKKNASKIYQPGVKTVEDSEIFPLLKSKMDEQKQRENTNPVCQIKTYDTVVDTVVVCLTSESVNRTTVSKCGPAPEKKPYINDAIKKKLGLQ